jgi:hypothetical protein
MVQIERMHKTAKRKDAEEEEKLSERDQSFLHAHRPYAGI